MGNLEVITIMYMGHQLTLRNESCIHNSIVRLAIVAPPSHIEFQKCVGNPCIGGLRNENTYDGYNLATRR